MAAREWQVPSTPGNEVHQRTIRTTMIRQSVGVPAGSGILKYEWRTPEIWVAVSA